MKPKGPVARRGDYTFSLIEHAVGAAFIARVHYARGCSKTGKMFGMFRGKRLVGVAQWLPPTKVAAQSVLRDDWRHVAALSRLAVADSEPQNATGMLLSRALQWLFAQRLDDGSPKWRAAVTYADSSQGHEGIIYRATNWVDVGESAAKPRWVDSAGRQVATQSGPKTRTAAEMRALGYVCTGSFKKRKFVFYSPRVKR